LGPANQGKQAEHHDVVNHVPVRVDDWQGNGDHRQRDPARPDSEKETLALAFRNRGFSELLGLLLGVSSPGGFAPEICDIGRFRQCAQDTRPQTECIG
jgi:hypothetical protein